MPPRVQCLNSTSVSLLPVSRSSTDTCCITEKTFLIPMIYGGMYMGEILGFSLSGLLVSSTIEMDGISYPWEWVFYLFGLWGIVWFPLWAMYAYERPEDHPGIDREELMLIGEGEFLSCGNACCTCGWMANTH